MEMKVHYAPFQWTDAVTLKDGDRFGFQKDGKVHHATYRAFLTGADECIRFVLAEVDKESWCVVDVKLITE